MRGGFSRLSLVLAAAALAMATAPAVSAAAAAAQDPVPIGPNEYFTGSVSGHPPGHAVIYVVCPGPIIHPGQTGRPLGNQPVEVEPAAASATDTGYTGSAGTSISAALAPVASATVIIANFTSYGVPVDIPTTIHVPCSGSGAISFIPLPGSTTARSATLGVTFVNVAT